MGALITTDLGVKSSPSVWNMPNNNKYTKNLTHLKMFELTALLILKVWIFDLISDLHENIVIWCCKLYLNGMRMIHINVKKKYTYLQLIK